ncbi:uncharacterized protein ACB058_014372 [Synchiropus picturatus]
MSNRLAFQTQLASIMEVLANAAVAEICKLVDDDYAVVSLQMSQCQRENKALKRKLHLLELKMARGNAERRLRESALNGGRARVQLNDRLRLSCPSAEAAEFDVTLWHGRHTLEDSTNKPVHPDSLQSKSPDVELVQPEVMLVKEEKVEDNILQLEAIDGDPPLIRSDGVVDRVHRGTAGNQATLKELSNQCHFSSRSSGVEEEEEPDVVLVKVEEGEQGMKLQNPTCLSIQEGLVESSTGNQIQEPSHGFSESRGLPSTLGLSGESGRFKPGTRSSSGPHEPQPPAPRTDYSVFELETILTHWAPEDHPSPSPSCSFATQAEGVQEDVIIVTSETTSGCAQVGPPAASSAPARPLTNTSLPQWAGTLPLKNRRSQLHHPSFSKSAMEGSTALTADSSSSTSSTAPSQYPVSVQGPASGLPRQLHGGLTPRHCKLRTTHRRKGFVCRVCGKAFPGQSNLEAHERVHTGERPFHCDTCGKQFSEAGNLKKHQRVHTGEKPFRCENCGKRFAWICNLRTHQLSATCCGPQIQGGLT